MQTVENLPAGIVDRHRINVAADGCARRIHARDDGELRVGGEQQHQQHQNALRNDAAVMCPPQHHRNEENQPAEHAYPVQTYQRTANDETGGVYTLLPKEPWKLSKRNGGEHGAKKDERSQPDAERKIDHRMKESSHSGGRPVSRSIRLAIGG